ncbi:hypothetical protein [Psychrilyobacter atlanticus]|uniref:hypothetical protein n=1 Tax=Psychrilyobacter atlanticus TaxID=271091 RepID=UPI000407D5C2|nr:hypothetical protein [Psychrilyobacter atlanticus]
MKTKKEVLKKLETRPHTKKYAKKQCFKFGLDIELLNKFWLGDIEPMGTKKYFFTRKRKIQFQRFIISNRDYEVEIKKNQKEKDKILNLKKDEKIRKCTKCKKEFITKVDRLGVSYDTRCKKCKTNERYDHSGRLNGRLGKVEGRSN